MKKKYINLIATKADYQKLEIIFYRLRILTFFSFFVAIFLTMGFYIIIQTQNNMIAQILNEKKMLLQGEEKYNQEKEAKLLRFSEAYKNFEQFLKNDANALPYYQILNTSLSQATQSALIKAFNINKNRDVDFIVTFNNFEEMINFLRLSENKDFLSKFDNLILKSFSVIKGESLIENYELRFSGRFKNMHENQN